MVSIVGVVLIPIWLIVGPFFIGRYLDKLRCAVTRRSVVLNKGLMVRVEKTVPMEKITDIGMVQGPIMRMLDLHKLSFETAGQTSGAAAATLSIVGIENAQEFRDQVLRLRDEFTDQATTSSTSPSSDSNDSSLEKLDAILSVLQRIEKKIEK